MWRQNIEQAEEERKRHTAIIEEYKKVRTYVLNVCLSFV